MGVYEYCARLYKDMMEALVAADAELKIVIAGNHDITLHEEYYIRDGKDMFHRGISEDLEQIRELWMGEATKKAGIVYLEEGTRTFDLSYGARFTASRIQTVSRRLPGTRPFVAHRFGSPYLVICLSMAARILQLGLQLQPR